ncbi:MAG: hypothetical protein HQK69_05900 [Desulfamplus sp.]|nr:hypothetical protein [Desulfamplus sp.]
MTKLSFIELWIAAQLFINIFLAMLLWRFVKKMKTIEMEFLNVIKSDDLDPLTDSIHQEIIERIDKLIHNMGEKAAVEMVDRAAQDITDLIEPLVKDSQTKAALFEKQIKDKHRIIKHLNDSLDSRIISVNLLLSRAEVILNSKDKSIYQNQNTPQSYQSQNNSGIRNSNTQGLLKSGIRGAVSGFYDPKWLNEDDSNGNNSEDNLIDQQQKIIELYQQGLHIDAIASKLSIPRGEVQLVISLKEKFMKMEG